MPDKMKDGNYIAAYIGEYNFNFSEPLRKGEYEISIKEKRYSGIVGYAVAWHEDQDFYPVYENQSQFDDNWVIISENPNGKYLFKYGRP